MSAQAVKQSHPDFHLTAVFLHSTAAYILEWLPDTALCPPERLAVLQAQLVHGKQDAAVHRLQAVAHVRQRAAYDDRHGVLQAETAQEGQREEGFKHGQRTQEQGAQRR